MNDSKTIKVSGVAIRAGVSRNGVKYLPEELAKFARTLENRPILKDHDARTDNAIGLVTKSFTTDMGESVNYAGWIKEDGSGIIERINDKRIKEVSIGAIAGRLVQESEDSDVVIAQGLVGLELSTTPVPGVQGTSLNNTLGKLSEGKKVALIENVNSFTKIQEVSEEMDEKKCPECGAMVAVEDMKVHMLKHKEEESLKGALNEKTYNDMVTRLKEDGLLKDFKLTFEQWSNEVKKVAEDNAAKVTEDMKNLQEEINALKAEKRNRLVEEYKAVASEKGVAERDVKDLAVESIALLVSELKSIKTDMTRAKVLQNDAKPAQKVWETTHSFGQEGLISNEGLMIERPLDGGNKLAMTFDPSKLKAEGARWRLFKNPSPMFGR